MFAPDITTHELAHLIQHERLSHAALLQKVARERSPSSTGVDRQAQRRITSRRLAATLAAATLTLAIAAAVAATQQPEASAQHKSQGGGVTLIR